MFDYDSYGNNLIGLQIGGLETNQTFNTSIDLSTITNLVSKKINSYYAQALMYRFRITSSNIQIYIGLDAYSLAFDLSSFTS